MTLTRQDDRCDVCGAQAFVRVTSRETCRNLMFCGHDYARHEMALVMAGWIVEDDRNQIGATSP